MSFVKNLAAAAILAAGSLASAGSASASPLAPVVPVARGGGVIAPVQYYGPPRYERRRYRPVRRTVCRTVFRSVRTPAGYWVRRPVQSCRVVYR
jgi:hypothetical protein